MNLAQQVKNRKLYSELFKYIEDLESSDLPGSEVNFNKAKQLVNHIKETSMFNEDREEMCQYLFLNSPSEIRAIFLIDEVMNFTEKASISLNHKEYKLLSDEAKSNNKVLRNILINLDNSLNRQLKVDDPSVIDFMNNVPNDVKNSQFFQIELMNLENLESFTNPESYKKLSVVTYAMYQAITNHNNNTVNKLFEKADEELMDSLIVNYFVKGSYLKLPDHLKTREDAIFEALDYSDHVIYSIPDNVRFSEEGLSKISKIILDTFIDGGKVHTAKNPMNINERIDKLCKVIGLEPKEGSDRKSKEFQLAQACYININDTPEENRKPIRP